MKIKLVLVLLLSSYFSLTAQSGLFKANTFGIGIDFGGTDMKSTLGLNINSKLTKFFSTNLRYASNFEEVFRIGGGIEFHPWEKAKIRPSVGIEMYHNREFFYTQGLEFPIKYRSTHIPWTVQFSLSPRFSFDVGLVWVYSNIGGTDGTMLRTNINYRF